MINYLNEEFIQEMEIQIYKRIELDIDTEDIMYEMRDSFAEMFQESMNITLKEAQIAGKKLAMQIFEKISKKYGIEFDVNC